MKKLPGLSISQSSSYPLEHRKQSLPPISASERSTRFRTITPSPTPSKHNYSGTSAIHCKHSHPPPPSPPSPSNGGNINNPSPKYLAALPNGSSTVLKASGAELPMLQLLWLIGWLSGPNATGRLRTKLIWTFTPLLLRDLWG